MKLALKDLSQLVTVSRWLNLSAHHHGDSAPLLAHQDDDGVRLFREADGSTVPRSHEPRDVLGESQGQEDLCGQDALIADDNGPIMQRTGGVEERQEQRLDLSVLS